MSHYIQAELLEPGLVPTANLMTLSGREKSTDNARFFAAKISQKAVGQLIQDGYTAMQSHLLLPVNLKPFLQADMLCTKAAIIQIDALEKQVIHWLAVGYSAATIIIGKGYETKFQCIDITQKVVTIAKKYNFPIAIELHRASITQNIHNTLAIVQACPEVCFNADFSHYILAYCLLDLSEAERQNFIRLIDPILARVIFFHCRFATNTEIQTPLIDNRKDEKSVSSISDSSRARTLYFDLLDRVFQHFKAQADTGEGLFIAPEILPPFTGYTSMKRTVFGHKEKLDRYQESNYFIQSTQQLFNRINGLNVLYEHSSSNCHTKPKVLTIDTQSQLIKIKHLAAFEYINHLQLHKKIIRVELGSQLNSAKENAALIEQFILLQEKDSRFLLETARNTVTHSFYETLEILTANPSLKLSLNAKEWVLAFEIRIDALPTFHKQIQQLMPAVLWLVKEYATAEYQYTPMRYGPWVYLPVNGRSISVMIESIYSIYWKWLFK